MQLEQHLENTMPNILLPLVPLLVVQSSAGAAICEPVPCDRRRRRAQRCAQPDKIDLHLAHGPYFDYPITLQAPLAS